VGTATKRQQNGGEHGAWIRTRNACTRDHRQAHRRRTHTSSHTRSSRCSSSIVNWSAHSPQSAFLRRQRAVTRTRQAGRARAPGTYAACARQIRRVQAAPARTDTGGSTHRVRIAMPTVAGALRCRRGTCHGCRATGNRRAPQANAAGAVAPRGCEREVAGATASRPSASAASSIAGQRGRDHMRRCRERSGTPRAPWGGCRDGRPAGSRPPLLGPLQLGCRGRVQVPVFGVGYSTRAQQGLCEASEAGLPRRVTRAPEEGPETRVKWMTPK
jgi:hypothetical protein